MKRIKIVCFGFLLLIASNLIAQQIGIEYDEINGKLTMQDKYKKEFGRYKGFELQLNEGEMANFVVSSNDFNPRLVLVNPKGKIYKQSQITSGSFASLFTEVPESGDWILYIIGSMNDKGNYLLRYAFADKSALSTQMNLDFCSSVNFLISHANAYFLMLAQEASNKSLIKFPNSIEAFLDSETASYVNIFLQTKNKNEVELEYNKVKDQINNCLPEWRFKSDDWKKIEDIERKSTSYIESTGKKPIKVLLMINHQLKNDNENSIHELSLEISKTP